MREKLAALVPDALASLVVVLVAIPLCIGIAVGCGVPPERGLITGVLGGIFVGLLSGSPLLVSGPAASLIVPVFDVVQSRGLAALAPIVMLAGVWQVLAGRLRLGQWFRAVAPAVIHGMLLGIGVLIIGSQLRVAIDVDPTKGFVDNMRLFPGELWAALSSGQLPTMAPALVGLGTLLLLVGWNRLRPNRLRLVPGHLVSVVLVVVAVSVLDAPVRFLDVSPQFFAGLDLASAETLTFIDSSTIGLSLMFAFIASAATLLTAVAIDQKQSFVKTDYNRELVAQGLGNLSAGALGGLPMTGVIVRSSVNVDSGARTRVSTILHGIWILAFVAAFPGVLAMIPRACLGAILVYTGFKLFDYKILRMLYRRGSGELVICLVTLGGVVFIELFTGILMGLGAALIKIVYTFSHVEIDLEESEVGEYRLDLAGSATFLRLPALAEALDKVPGDRPLRLGINRLDHIDHACLELLANWDQQRKAKGSAPLIVDWGHLGNRYHRVLRGAASPHSRNTYSAGAVGSLLLSEWRRIYEPVEDPERRNLLGADWIDQTRIGLSVSAKDAEALYELAADLLATAAGIDARKLAALLAERGESGGFSIGEGVAIPHVSVPGLDRAMVAFVTTEAPIDIDGDPLDVFFVLTTPEGDPQRHLLALAHIARICRNSEVLMALRASESPAEVYRILAAAEENSGVPISEDDAKLLAVLDFAEDAVAEQARELLTEGFGPPALLAVDDGAMFEAFRALLQLPPSRRLVVLALELRDGGVLMNLLGEVRRLHDNASIGLSFLRREDDGSESVSRMRSFSELSASL